MTSYDWEDEGYFPTETRDLARIRRVLIVTMLLNFLATGVKLAAGLLTGALSVVADALDSLFDGLSNVVGLAGLVAASKPPDAEHPYGHRKFETIAAISISILLFITSWQLLVLAWGRFQSNVGIEVNFWVVGAMAAAMLIQGLTSYYELRQGRELHSEVLVADAMHTRASILVSLSVLGGLGLILLGFSRADALLAAFVAIMIAKIGVDILKENMPVLVDRAAIDPQKIASVVKEVGGVQTFHRVRSRGAAGSAAVDLHIQVSPESTLEEANAVADEVRRRLLALDEVNDVTVHLEAHRDGKSNATQIFSAIRHAANELGLVVHEAWVHSMDGNLTAEIHVGVNPNATLGEAHIQVDQLERAIKERLPQIVGVHTHLELASEAIQVADEVSDEFNKFVRNEVEQVVKEVPALGHPHNIVVKRNRSAGNNLFISLECTLTPETPIAEAHELASAVEGEIRRRLRRVAEVSVHLEPPGEA
jgi:cation diffusion facilitator family transporter